MVQSIMKTKRKSQSGHIYNTNSWTGHLFDVAPRQNHANDPNGAIGWQPIQELESPDADVALVFIANNNVKYAKPVDDPIFAAHDPNEAGDRFWGDYWVPVLGCTEQYRFCKSTSADKTECTDYLGEFQAFNAFETIKPTEAQIQTMNRLWDTLTMTIYDYVRARNSQALQVSDTIVNYESPGLPANQWMLEVQGWFDVNLAHIQHSVVEWTTGPSDPTLAAAILQTRTNDTYGSTMCKSQMVHETAGTSSFSLLGVVILFVVGAGIIGLSFVLDTVIAWLQKRFGRGEIARLSWISDDKLQLHRVLSHELQLGNWEKSEAAVPTTKERHSYLSLAASVVLDTHAEALVVDKSEASTNFSGPLYGQVSNYGIVSGHQI